MKSLGRLILIILFISPMFTKAQNLINNGKGYFLADKIVVKFTEENLAMGKSVNGSLISKLNKFGITNIEKRFKVKKTINKSNLSINKIAVLTYSGSNLDLVIRKISKLKEVEWAEPYFIDEIMFTPNDPELSQQYALSKISAELAWDINKGSSDIIIAIDDTGVDWDHPDLAANIWNNSGEIAGNGIDDDNNGYIDDIRGWDFGGVNGTPDNNPTEDRPDHGTHVAGIASAVTDNNIGISSIGYNCTIMPVKTSRDDVRDDSQNALIYYGYNGIIYAVDNGAKVINCSWGSYNYSQANQEVINYAAANGVLVVGAASNENVAEIIYPGAYKGAFSVGSTDQGDRKSSFSNYGKFVDVMAPGSLIYGTWQNNTYTKLNGSSMASPLVAGLAGLVFNQFPNYTPLQIAEQIRVTCDNIDAENPNYNYLLGGGRVNAYKALTDTTTKSVRIKSYTVNDEGDGDGILEAGEQISILVEFTNYLSPLSNFSAELLSKSSYATVTAGSFVAGSAGTMESFSNSSSLYKFTISSNVPENTDLEFMIEYNDGAYNSFEWITLLANPSYLTQSGNLISVTVTSRGTIGFNDYPDNVQGDGLKIDQSENVLFEGALIYGTSNKTLANAARGENPSVSDNDFAIVSPFIIETPGSQADEQGKTVFDDSNLGASALGIETTLNTYSYSDVENENYIIFHYNFKNTSDKEISNFRAGLYFDWDIDESSFDKNSTGFDSLGGFGYAYNNNFDPVSEYIAVALISEGEYSFYGILNDGSDGEMDVYNNFTDIEKWTTLSSGVSNTDKGIGDISFVAGAGAYTIAAGGSKDVAFAIAAESSMESLRSVINRAAAKYSLITVVKNTDPEKPFAFELSQNYPNPFNPSTIISYQLPEDGIVSLKIYDILGSEVATLVNSEQSAGYHKINFNASSVNRRISSGVYFYTLKAGNYINTKKLVLLR